MTYFGVYVTYGFSGEHTVNTLGFEKVYLPLCKVADTPFPIQGGELISNHCVIPSFRNIENKLCETDTDI